nr:MAG TPA: hypothetical protein [Caudoviricetes sp.]
MKGRSSRKYSYDNKAKIIHTFNRNIICLKNHRVRAKM